MSSLLDHGLIKTTAVEQVVAPIAGHLCHLVLLCENAEDPEQFAQLEGAAQAVAKATNSMAAVASRYVYSMCTEAKENLLLHYKKIYEHHKNIY